MTTDLEDKANGAAGRPPDDDQALAELMSLAGNRREIPKDVERRVRATVQAEWRQATTVRRTLSWSLPLALAASVILALTVILQSPVETPALVGTVAKVESDTGRYAAGDRLQVGDSLSTSQAGGLSFTLGNGTSVRLARNSFLDIDSIEAFTLLAGAVYVDSGESAFRDGSVTISTEFGEITDIGTQFLVSVDPATLSVAVREGKVDIATGAATLSAEAGKRVTLAPGALPVEDSISPLDTDWDWAEALAPKFVIDGKSVLDFLKWVARETGMELEFPNEDDRRAAMASRLYGSIDDLTPMEALVSVMSTTSFDYVIDGDAISVHR